MPIEKFKKMHDVFQITNDLYIEEWTKVKLNMIMVHLKKFKVKNQIDR
jgi:hypothetical protein